MQQLIVERGESLSTRWADFRSTWRVSKAERAAFRALDRQLSSYRTAGELDELEAIVERVERINNTSLDDYRKIISRRRKCAQLSPRRVHGFPVQSVHALVLMR